MNVPQQEDNANEAPSSEDKKEEVNDSNVEGDDTNATNVIDECIERHEAIPYLDEVSWVWLGSSLMLIN